MDDFHSKRDAFLRTVVEHLPPHSALVGYGSGVFPQKDQTRERMVDLLVVVDSLEDFHARNIELNPAHYGFLVRGSSVRRRIIEWLQNSYFPVFYFTHEQLAGRRYKYGVISKAALLDELATWEHFGIAGRLQKPVLLLGSDAADIDSLNQFNRQDAVT